jgi:hypothetical protein
MSLNKIVLVVSGVGNAISAVRNPKFDKDLERLKSAPRYNCATAVKGHFKKLPETPPHDGIARDNCC